MTILMIEQAESWAQSNKKMLPFVATFPLIASLCFACKNYRWVPSIALSTTCIVLNSRACSVEDLTIEALHFSIPLIAISLGVASLFQISTSSPLSFAAPLLSVYALLGSSKTFQKLNKIKSTLPFELLLIPAGYSLLRPHTSFGMTALFACFAVNSPAAMLVHGMLPKSSPFKKPWSSIMARDPMAKGHYNFLIGAALVGTTASINALRHSRSFGNFISLFVYASPLVGAGYYFDKKGRYQRQIISSFYN